MYALRFHQFGSPPVLKVEALPIPQPGPGEVLVRVHAASINPSDIANVAGRLGATVPPRIPGRDLAGVVAAPSELKGLEVWAAGGDLGFGRDGSHAEYVVAPAALVRPKPAALSMAEAASAGLVYVTAFAALLLGHLQAGETVLITGAAGGVGGAAAQLARWQGARVIALDQLNVTGGDLNLTTAANWRERVAEFTSRRGVDLVFDCVGGPLFEPVLGTLAPRGRQVAIASPAQHRVSFDLVNFYHRQLTLHGLDSLALDAATCGDILDAMRPSFEAGHLTAPKLARVVPLEQGAEAFEAVAAGRTVGKIVFTLA